MFASGGTARIAFLTAILTASGALAERTVWLVRPLYPGQETLIERTQQALDKLIPAADRGNEIIGVKELAASLRGKMVAEIPCLSADSRCADPIDLYVASLGYDRVVLIQGGQDEAGFKFRVVSYRPSTKEMNPATATNAVLEKALLGAVAKVVPVASSLQVTSVPPGATIYIDDVKVGITPLSTQVLPGERVIRLDLKLHQPIEETLLIPVRGTATLTKNLEKVAARIVITASPAGTVIQVDGQTLGKDKVDRGILPGQHTIRLSAEGHKDFEQAIAVKADEQYQLDKTLEPVPGVVAPEPKLQIVAVPQPEIVAPPAAPPAPPPPPPPTETELTYSRGPYFSASFEYAKYESNRLVGRRFGDNGFGRTTFITTPARTLVGAAAEFGMFGKYIGVMVFGASYLTFLDPVQMDAGFSKGGHQETQFSDGSGARFGEHIGPVKIHLVTLRLIQPQVRIAAWKFQFGLQAGFEVRAGQILEDPLPTVEMGGYKDGFLVLDLLVAARANVRFLIYEGFFIHLSGNYSWFIFGDTAACTGNSNCVVNPAKPDIQSGNQFGLNVGIGYGF